MTGNIARLQEGHNIVSLPYSAAAILKPQMHGISPNTSENLFAFYKEE